MMFAKCIFGQMYSVVSISYYALLYTLTNLFGFENIVENVTKTRC